MKDTPNLVNLHDFPTKTPQLEPSATNNYKLNIYAPPPCKFRLKCFDRLKISLNFAMFYRNGKTTTPD